MDLARHAFYFIRFGQKVIYWFNLAMQLHTMLGGSLRCIQDKNKFDFNPNTYKIYTNKDVYTIWMQLDQLNVYNNYNIVHTNI